MLARPQAIIEKPSTARIGISTQLNPASFVTATALPVQKAPHRKMRGALRVTVSLVQGRAGLKQLHDPHSPLISHACACCAVLYIWAYIDSASTVIRTTPSCLDLDFKRSRHPTTFGSQRQDPTTRAVGKTEVGGPEQTERSLQGVFVLGRSSHTPSAPRRERHQRQSGPERSLSVQRMRVSRGTACSQ